jgi:hypothetical protein
MSTMVVDTDVVSFLLRRFWPKTLNLLPRNLEGFDRKP